MTETMLQQVLLRGEDGRHQFKRDATNADGVAAELSAFANSGGGHVFIGVADDGRIVGLDGCAVRRLNQLLSNAASQHVRPPIHPLTENVQTAQGIVVVVTVPTQFALLNTQA
ncbi:MAG: ATP-binding protein [Duganella sp.]